MKSSKQIERHVKLIVSTIYEYNNQMLAMKPGSQQWNEMVEAVNSMQVQLSTLLWVLEKPVDI